MKHINEFIKFDFESWANGKDFKVTNITPWIDRDNGSVIGSVVEVVILRDDCKAYKLKTDENFNMIYEKIKFKCKNCKVAIGDLVQVEKPEPVVYVNNGFMNVSFKCDAVIKIKNT